MANVKIYTTPTCPWCKKTKEFLKEHNVAYEDFNVKEDDKAREEMIAKSGQGGVPVLDIDGKIIIGFDEKEIKKTLGLR